MRFHGFMNAPITAGQKTIVTNGKVLPVATELKVHDDIGRNTEGSGEIVRARQVVTIWISSFGSLNWTLLLLLLLLLLLDRGRRWSLSLVRRQRSWMTGRRTVGSWREGWIETWGALHVGVQGWGIRAGIVHQVVGVRGEHGRTWIHGVGLGGWLLIGRAIDLKGSGGAAFLDLEIR
jgi:hypothetical protein